MLGNQYELRIRLLRVAGLPRMVCLKREVVSEPRHLGYVMEVGREIVLLYHFADFWPDGISVFRLSDVEEVQRGPRERFWDRMLATEGVMPHVALPRPLDTGSMASLLKSLHARGKNIVVECEGTDSADDDTYHIGRINSVDCDTLSFQWFNCIGEWQPDPIEFDIDTITRVQFDTPYIHTISRYVR